MRTLYFIAIVAAIFVNCSSSKNVVENVSQIDLLFSISTEVKSILEYVREEYEKDYKFTNQVFILRTEKVRDSLEVIVSVYDESDFSNCFQPNLFPLYGLYKFDSNSVLVYGGDSQMLFKKKGEQMTYDLLKCKKKEIGKTKGDIPYPPEIFEPNVWIFSGNSKILTFKEQSQFNIIE